MPFLRPTVIALLVLLGGLCAAAASVEGLAPALAAAILIALLAAGVTARLPGSRSMAPTAYVDESADEPPAERRLAELEAATSTLRHDVRGALSPAMLVADRLLDSNDPATKRAGEVVVASIERVEKRLLETREQRQ